MKSKKIFLDTHFLFYLYTAQDIDKQKKAIAFLEKHKEAQFFTTLYSYKKNCILHLPEN